MLLFAPRRFPLLVFTPLCLSCSWSLLPISNLLIPLSWIVSVSHKYFVIKKLCIIFSWVPGRKKNYIKNKSASQFLSLFLLGNSALTVDLGICDPLLECTWCPAVTSFRVGLSCREQSCSKLYVPLLAQPAPNDWARWGYKGPSVWTQCGPLWRAKCALGLPAGFVESALKLIFSSLQSCFFLLLSQVWIPDKYLAPQTLHQHLLPENPNWSKHLQGNRLVKWFLQ